MLHGDLRVLSGGLAVLGEPADAVLGGSVALLGRIHEQVERRRPVAGGLGLLAAGVDFGRRIRQRGAGAEQQRDTQACRPRRLRDSGGALR